MPKWRSLNFCVQVESLIHRLQLYKRDLVRSEVLRVSSAIVSRCREDERRVMLSDYIQLYHGNASLLAESLEVIQKTSAVILTALEPKPDFEDQDSQGEMAVTS